MGEPFDIKKWFSGFLDPTTWGKSILYLVMACAVLFIAFAIKNTFFPSKAITNKPHTLIIGKAEAGAVNQSSTNTVVEKEKDWSVSVGGGAIEYDSKKGYFGGMAVTKKFDKLFGIF
jgi:hypothetical protein